MLDDEGTPIVDENYGDDTEDVPVEKGLFGAVIPVSGGLGSGSGQSIDVILAIMHKSGIKGWSINATNPAGYRGPRHSNDGGYHSSSQAVDLGGGGNASVRDQVAKFWYQFAPNLLELIHSHTPGYPYAGWYIKNGHVVRPYGPASAHFNHIHVALRASAGYAILKKLGAGGAAPAPVDELPTGEQTWGYKIDSSLYGSPMTSADLLKQGYILNTEVAQVKTELDSVKSALARVETAVRNR